MPRKPKPRNKPIETFCNGEVEVELYSDDAPPNQKQDYSREILKTQGTVMCKHIIECIERNRPLTFMKNKESFKTECAFVLSAHNTDPNTIKTKEFRNVLGATIKQLTGYMNAIETQPLSERNDLAIKVHSTIQDLISKNKTMKKYFEKVH